MGGSNEKALDAAWADVGRLEAENKRQAEVIEQMDRVVVAAKRWRETERHYENVEQRDAGDQLSKTIEAYVEWCYPGITASPTMQAGVAFAEAWNQKAGKATIAKLEQRLKDEASSFCRAHGIAQQAFYDMEKRAQAAEAKLASVTAIEPQPISALDAMRAIPREKRPHVGGPDCIACRASEADRDAGLPGITKEGDAK